ncbi:hypothetical protein Vadar_015986 [Vaccinium darrowii]|uniref:Uncharacterized protein n=1 Tax=Vaccinium darrowii TaxID=229202 RepID=A0ACB7Y6W5_9ERIC|nr:hypothetical protein Vadar_015986 [Vaccinium darrowii]
MERTRKRKTPTLEQNTTTKRPTMDFCAKIANQLMLKKIQNGFSKNIVSSSLSIEAVLNMLVAGSTGRTLERMLGFLGSKSVDEVNAKSRKMMAVAEYCECAEDASNGPILNVINGAWVDQRFPLVHKYEEEVLKAIFKCEGNTVDFATKADQVVDEINSWADTASRGLINEILQHGSVPRETALILANAIYFKGIWDCDYKFDARRTEDRKFYLLNGSTVLAPFMTSGRTYYCGSFDGFKVLKIPYQSGKSNNFSMYFFLPDEQDGLQNLLVLLDSDSGFLNQKYRELREQKLDKFWIPKFKFSFNFDVSKVMHDMGESSSFIENPRDLSEMLQNCENVPFLNTKMFQKAYIEVDEKGTEAVAITVLHCEGCGRPPPKIKRLSFVADHPFIFMITEERSGLVFFTGAVLNPIQKD